MALFEQKIITQRNAKITKKYYIAEKFISPTTLAQRPRRIKKRKNLCKGSYVDDVALRTNNL